MKYKYKKWLINGLRFISQLSFFVLFGNLTIIIGAIIGFDKVEPSGYGIPVPVNQPVAAPYTTGFNIFELIQWELTHAIFPFLSLGLLFIFGIIFGRGYCAWVCPFGFIQDIASWIPVKKIIPSKETNKTFNKAKFLYLFICIFFTLWICYLVVIGSITEANRGISQFGVFVDIVSAPFSPSNTLFTLIPDVIKNGTLLNISGTVWDVLLAYPWFFFQVFLLLIILLISVYISRFWCRYFCPTGALMGLFNHHRIIYLGRDPGKCLGKKCRKCEIVCPMGIRILDNPWEKIKSTNCISCMKCYLACDKDAIKLKFF